MEIILLEKVNKLGEIGQTVKVKDGYARNFLLPNKIAVRATVENKKIFDAKREEFEKANQEKKKIAEDKLKKLPKSIDIFREASEQGALFGSVTSRDIIKTLKEFSDKEVKAKDVVLKQSIKNLGTFNVELILHPEVVGNLKINILNIEEKKK